ncbi:hypothetical protein Hanom_Chr14g01284181 [Helianthus anomalus]
MMLYIKHISICISREYFKFLIIFSSFLALSSLFLPESHQSQNSQKIVEDQRAPAA